MLVGVGVNVNSRIQDFPVEVQSIVTTVHEHLRESLPLPELLPRFVRAISARVAMLRDYRASVLAEWQRFDYLFGKDIVCTAGAVVREGVAAGLTDEGRYRLRDASGTVHEVIGGQLRLHSHPEAKTRTLPPPPVS